MLKLTPKLSSLRNFSKTTIKLQQAAAQKSNDEYFKAMHESQTTNEKPKGWDEALPYSKMPGPMPLPLLGNWWRFLWEFKGLDFYDIQKKLYKQYGDFYVLRKLVKNEDMVMVSNPDLAEQVFRNEGIWPRRDVLDIMDHYRKDLRPDIFGGISGLITDHGEKWYKTRTTVNPILMQPRVAVQYIKNMDVIAQEFVERIKMLSKSSPNNEMPHNFENELNRWSLESICVIALDKRLGCLDPQPNKLAMSLINAVNELFYLTYQLEFQVSLWRIYATRDYKRFVEVGDHMCKVVQEIVEEAYNNIKNSPEKPVNEQSAFEKMLKIDKNIAFVMSLDMLNAGIDTTSKTVGSALYLLAKNPKVQEKLREELCRLMPSKDTPISKEILDGASYLKAVVKETQRIAPISLGNARRSQKDMVLGGYQIPKGTALFINNLIMVNRDFPRPQEFIPERWLRSTKDELSHKNVHPFTALPFGFGPRSCVGKRLALLEIETLIAKVVRNFALEWHHPDLKYKQLFLYGFVDPLKLTVKALHK